MRMLVNWLLSAVSLLIVAHLVPGFYVRGLFVALLAAVVIGFVNATLGLLLKLITLPLTILTLGIFWFLINAAMLKLASLFVPGFQVRGFFAAFFGSLVLSLVNLLLHWLVMPKKQRPE